MRSDTGLFPAVLRHWRARRGWSQLDLALAANVSARHISFLETGRSQPSREMAMRLGATLHLSLRDRNEMLRAAGYDDAFSEPSWSGGLPPPLQQAIERMCAQQEPYPLLVFNRHYEMLHANRGAWRLLGMAIGIAPGGTEPINFVRMLFEPGVPRSKVVDWERTAKDILSRMHRELLARPNDTGLAELLQSILALPDVPKEWHQPDLSMPVEPVFVLRFRHEDIELAFLTTVTVFHAPQNVLLDEIVIESYFPFDEATATVCTALAAMA